jgi:hypothetical protein
MLAIIFIAGVLHGLGPDHLAAITAVAGAGAGFHRIAACALRFALGHALVIAAAGGAALAGRQLLPATWEVRFDLFAGTLLVLAGAVFLVGLATRRIVAHEHLHSHGVAAHSHFHLHFKSSTAHTHIAAHSHVHDISSLALGALFALGGSRTVLAIAPLALAHSIVESSLRITAFAAGIVIAMVGFGAAASRVLRSQALSVQRMGFLTGALCIAAGSWTIVSHLHR